MNRKQFFIYALILLVAGVSFWLISENQYRRLMQDRDGNEDASFLKAASRFADMEDYLARAYPHGKKGGAPALVAGAPVSFAERFASDYKLEEAGALPALKEEKKVK